MSDVVFVYPLVASDFLGESLLSWQGRSNAFGESVAVRKMETLDTAGAATLGALSTGATTSTFVSSQVLPSMQANMHAIARAGECSLIKSRLVQFLTVCSRFCHHQGMPASSTSARTRSPTT